MEEKREISIECPGFLSGPSPLTIIPPSVHSPAISLTQNHEQEGGALSVQYGKGVGTGH